MKCPFRDQVIVTKTGNTQETKVYYEKCYGTECQMYNKKTEGCIRCEMMATRKT